jgi:hypothetical protein
VSCILSICPDISGWSVSICSCRSYVNRICRLWRSLNHFIRLNQFFYCFATSLTAPPLEVRASECGRRAGWPVAANDVDRCRCQRIAQQFSQTLACCVKSRPDKGSRIWECFFDLPAQSVKVHEQIQNGILSFGEMVTHGSPGSHRTVYGN